MSKIVLSSQNFANNLPKEVNIPEICAVWWILPSKTGYWTSYDPFEGVLEIPKFSRYEFSVNLKSNDAIIMTLPYQLVQKKTVNFILNYPHQIHLNYDSMRNYYQPQLSDLNVNGYEIEILIKRRAKTYDNHFLEGRISKRYSEILENQLYSDFLIVVKRKKFKVHRAILASQSPVFKTMFDGCMQESIQNQSKVDHVKPEIFAHLLSFIYSEKIPENLEDVAMELYEAAHYYQVENLKEICEEEVYGQLTAENALEMYKWAFLYEIDDLKAEAWKIVKCEILKILSPMKNEPLSPTEIDEIIEHKKRDSEFWNKFI